MAKEEHGDFQRRNGCMSGMKYEKYKNNNTID